MKKKLLILFAFLYSLTCLKAQDANYWSPAYGPAGFFSPGAVIARNQDSGVLFYNPALQAFSNRNAASITGTIYQLESHKIHEGAGAGYPLKSTNTSIVPLIASNSIAFKTKLPITLVYAIVHNSVIGYNVSQRADKEQNVLDDSYSPGDEVFIGQFSQSNGIAQTSLLISAGFRLSEKFSVGLSMEGIYHKQYYLVDYKLRALENVSSDTIFPPVVSTQEYYSISGNHGGIKFKAGLSYSPSERHHLGLIVTMPLIHVMGKATLVSDVEINRINLGGFELNLLANTRQTGLPVRVHTPVSIGIGYTYHYAKGELYFVTEGFSKVNEYNVVTPKASTFIRPDTTTSTAPSILKLKDVRKSVFNGGIGISHRLNPSLTGYFSFRTDFTFTDDDLYKDDNGYSVNTSRFNIYHTQIGVNLMRKKYNLRAGILLSYGSSSQYPQLVNFNDPKDTNLLLGTLGTSKASYFSGGIMISYIHNF